MGIKNHILKGQKMSELLTGDGRTHVSSGLMRESLVSKKLIAETDRKDVRRMVPDVNMVSIGGQSIMDRGHDAIIPMVDEIAKLKEIKIALILLFSLDSM